MTVRHEQAPDDLDAGWDEVEPVPSRELSSPPPTSGRVTLPNVAQPSLPPTDEIDEGWDAPDPETPGGIADPKRLIGKRERRRLEREARAHQAARNKENRSERKAQRRAQAKQRAESSSQATPPQRSDPTPTPAKVKKSKQRRVASVDVPNASAGPQPSDHPLVGSGSATQPNRAQRRAKGGARSAARPNGPGGLDTTARSAVSGQTRHAAFALFFGAVIVLSVLSYFLIR